MTFIADRVTNVPVPFRQLRMKDAEGALQEGVVGANDLKIVQRAAGATQSVDFSVGACWINIDSGTRSGLVHVYNDAVANVAVTASNATNPRIDQAIVRYNDTSIPAGTGGNTPTPEILTGTATAGATLDNRTGAAALPNDCLRLADILVPATSTSVTTANIRDRRPWARGAYFRVVRNANAAAGSNYTTTSVSSVAIDGTNLAPRIECSGVPVRMTLRGSVAHSVANAAVAFLPWVDGTTIDGAGAASAVLMTTSSAASAFNSPHLTYDILPSAGSHVLQWAWFLVSAGTGTLVAAPTSPLVFTVEEIVRQNAANT